MKMIRQSSIAIKQLVFVQVCAGKRKVFMAVIVTVTYVRQLLKQCAAAIAQQYGSGIFIREFDYPHIIAHMRAMAQYTTMRTITIPGASPFQRDGPRQLKIKPVIDHDTLYQVYRFKTFFAQGPA